MQQNKLINKLDVHAILQNPKQYLLDSGYTEQQLSGLQIVVKSNTQQVTYFSMPHQTTLNLADIKAASGVSTAGSAATLGSVSSLCSSASSFATASSVGCAK